MVLGKKLVDVYRDDSRFLGQIHMERNQQIEILYMGIFFLTCRSENDANRLVKQDRNIVSIAVTDWTVIVSRLD